MPFFLILSVWVLCLLVGLVFLLFPGLRNFGLYLLLGSTGAVVGSLMLSTAALLAAESVPRGTWGGILIIGGFLAGLLVGGLVGGVGGLCLTFRWVARRKA